MNTMTLPVLKHLKDILIDNQIGDISMQNREEVISRLKFIGHIEKDEKINVRHVNRQPNNFFTKLSRSLVYPDNRINALKFIKDVIARSFEIIDAYIHEGNEMACRGIISDLLKARQGILNLKYTYNEDTKFCCDMDVVIEHIASRIASLKTSEPILFEESAVENKNEKM